MIDSKAPHRKLDPKETARLNFLYSLSMMFIFYGENKQNVPVNLLRRLANTKRYLAPDDFEEMASHFPLGSKTQKAVETLP